MCSSVPLSSCCLGNWRCCGPRSRRDPFRRVWPCGGRKPMRVIALISAVLVSAASAGQPAAIDLDKPGVIEQLQREHPQRLEAVSAVLRAWEHMPCKPGELETLRVQF